MIKSELIQRISEQNQDLRQNDVENIVNTMLDAITGAMARGDRVELRGFGVFSARNRAARAGRNPRIGADVAIEEKKRAVLQDGEGNAAAAELDADDLNLFVSITSGTNSPRLVERLRDDMRFAALAMVYPFPW